MKQMLTVKEAEKLVQEFDKNILAEIVNAMDNKLDLLKKYRSTNKTIRAWIKLRNENQKHKPQPTAPNREGLTLN